MRTLVIAGIVVAASTGTALAQDAAAGEQVFRRLCSPCHDIGPEAKVKLGPPLNGIEGRTALTPDCSIENWNRVIAINLTGVWLCMKAEITQMLKQGAGAIVNTSSIMGLTGAIRVPAYTAAKHGVAGLTKAAALEYGRQGIRINAVCPAPIYTPLLMGAFKKRPEMEQRYARSEPMKRLGQPEEVAEAVAWLCSDRASYVTGLPMPIDGGYMAQ